jgi:hypothetical protein
MKQKVKVKLKTKTVRMDRDHMISWSGQTSDKQFSSYRFYLEGGSVDNHIGYNQQQLLLLN